MGAEDLNPGATEGNPSDQDGTPGASNGNGWKPRKIKVRGQDFVVDSEAKATELMQKGATFEQSQARVKQLERELREKDAERLRELAPLIEIDRRLRTDPRKAQLVGAILNDQDIAPLLEAEADTDDVYLREIAGLKGHIRRLEARFQSDVGAVRGEVDGVRRSRRLDDEERSLKKKYPWATEEDLDEARRIADEKGLDLVTAFRDATFDETPERVRQETIREFGFDPSTVSPPRSEEFVLEGFGPITDERQLRNLYEDPDVYARFKVSNRARKRALSGKRELPR